MEGAAGAGDDAEAPCERRLPFARVEPAEGAGPGRAGAPPAGARIPGLPGSVPAAPRAERARSGREACAPLRAPLTAPWGPGSAQGLPRPGSPSRGGAVRGEPRSRQRAGRVALVALPPG